MVLIRRHEGYWRKYVKAARDGLAVCVLAVLIPIGSIAQPKNPSQDQANQSKTNPKSPIPLAASVQYQPTCGKPANAEDANYCIEKQATLAAKQQAKWSEDQFWASVAGIFSVVATLFYTAKATRAAISSVEASQRSATAAEVAVAKSDAALEHARETAKRQLRAYMGVELLGETTVVIKEPKWTVETPVGINNTGQTPASNVVMHSNICIADFPLTAPLPTLIKTDDGSKAVFFSGQPVTNTMIKSERRFTDADITNLRESTPSRPCQKRLYMYGMIEYVDVFGDSHTTKFRCMTIGAELNGAHFVWCPDGNEMT